MNTDGVIELIENASRQLALALELAREKKADTDTTPEECDDLDEAIDDATRRYW